MRFSYALQSLLLLISLTAGAAENDAIVKRFQSLVDAAPSTVDSAPPVVSPPNRGITEWYRRKVSIREVAFDVRRTDSLVSPIAGEIVFNCHFRHARARSEDELKDTQYGPDALVGQCRVNYAYQGQKWVRKIGHCTSVIERVPAPKPMDSPDRGVGYYCVNLLPQE